MSGRSVAIIGAGIVGLAHAWVAAERGWSATIFERDRVACQASVRNFGMIWPIGQAAGEPLRTAMASQRRWLRLGSEGVCVVNPCGSIHLAHSDDEWTVLQEFHARSVPLGYDCRLLTPQQVVQQSAAANPDRLIGGMFAASELCVNPPRAIEQIARWLGERFATQLRFGSLVTELLADVPGVRVRTSSGIDGAFDRAVVCGGADCRHLFPDLIAKSGQKLCKLQMLKTYRQPGDFRIGPHLASGLTLRHYRNFEVCPGLGQLKARIAGETPELDRFGIHVMASQNELGEVVLGDSHEYDSSIEPFDKSQIDELMLRELRKVIRLPDWTIQARWHGVYAKHPETPVFEAEPLPGVHVCTATGGAGMTLAFGIAERAWDRWSEA